MCWGGGGDGGGVWVGMGVGCGGVVVGDVRVNFNILCLLTTR